VDKMSDDGDLKEDRIELRSNRALMQFESNVVPCFEKLISK